MLRDDECMLVNGCLIFGGPMSEDKGELAECGLLSCGGDAMKHSSRDPRLLESAEAPLPNLNVGS